MKRAMDSSLPACIALCGDFTDSPDGTIESVSPLFYSAFGHVSCSGQCNINKCDAGGDLKSTCTLDSALFHCLGAPQP